MGGASLGSRPLDEEELEKINPQITANLRKLKPQLRYLHKKHSRGWTPSTAEDVENICGSIFKRLGRPRTRRAKEGSQRTARRSFHGRYDSLENDILKTRTFRSLHAVSYTHLTPVSYTHLTLPTTPYV